MCGIAGYISSSITRDSFLAGLDRLAHRGPDAYDFWCDNDMGLGHRRLAIIDLSPNANQPFRNETNTIHLVANGEIYNYCSCREQLLAAGHIFKSGSDCEVLLHGYEQWGMDGLLPRINGMFAFAILDSTARSLFLVRDRLGIKPLYYHYRKGMIVFASELGALIEMVPEPPVINRQARDEYFIFGYVGGPLTIYNDFFKLQPGQYLHYEKQNFSIYPYWQCPRPNSGDADKVLSKDDIAERLDRAVSDHMVADRPLGTLLSGGVDSTLISALTRSKVSKLRTFVIGFEFAEYDERQNAGEIADYLETDHSELYCSETDALEIIPHLPEIYSEPFADPSAIPTALLCRQVRDHVVVVLSGDGGDELGLGYDKYENSLKYRFLTSFPFRRMLGAGLEKCLSSESTFGKFAKFLRRGRLEDGLLLSTGIFNLISFDRLFGYSYNLPETGWWQSLQMESPANIEERWGWADLHHYLVDDVLTKVDRSSMRVALEVRVPLLDYRVVESIVSQHRSMKVQNGERKWIFRELLRRYVPENLWNRPKQGFGAPIKEWLRGPLNSMMHDYLSRARLSTSGELNVDFVQQLIAEHEGAVKDNSRLLWVLMNWELWREHAGFR